MPRSEITAKPKGYQIQVLLNGSQPSIWRRLQVPAAANLGWFHAVLQVAMGWTDSHLHQFICGENAYADAQAPLEQYEGDPPVLDESKFTLAELLKDIHQGLVYEYDFGDSWEHIVTVEKLVPADPSPSAIAVCLGGSRACPPEDCGGIGGYVELLRALKNSKHPEHMILSAYCRQIVGEMSPPNIAKHANVGPLARPARLASGKQHFCCSNLPRRRDQPMLCSSPQMPADKRR